MSSNQKGADQRQQQARNNNNRDQRKAEEDARNRGSQPGRPQQSQDAGRPHGADENRK